MPRQPLDLTNQRFGRLTVIKFADIYVEKNGHRRIRWLCQCDCGKSKTVITHRLTRGSTKSCGCLYIGPTSAQWKHGETSRHRIGKEYAIHRSMIARCNNNKVSSYKYYGARGIKVCDRWLNSFENFLEDMGRCPKGCSIDRVDPNGNYEPNNCRWTTAAQQACNKRNSKIITFNGERLHIKDWAAKYNKSYELVRHRLRAGWSIEKALTTPIKLTRPRKPQLSENINS